MSSYQQLAGAYDELTWDVGYEKRADFLEKPPQPHPGAHGAGPGLRHRVHDLAAGRAGL